MPNDGARRSQYRIVVRGRLSKRFASALEGPDFVVSHGTTAITGTLVDQAQLYGLIDRMRDLGVELLSVDVDDGKASGR